MLTNITTLFCIGMFLKNNISSAQSTLNDVWGNFIKNRTQEDREKLENFSKCYVNNHPANNSVHDLSKNSPNITFNKIELEFSNINSYPTNTGKTGGLSNFEIRKKIEFLCNKQQKYKKTGFKQAFINLISSDPRELDTPENIILEMFKKWLQEKSTIPENQFGDELYEEFKCEERFLIEISNVKNLSVSFKKTLSNLQQYIKVMKEHVKEKASQYKCQRLFAQLKLQGTNVIDNCIKILCYKVDEKLVGKAVNDLSFSLEKLKNDFCAKLIVKLISNPNIKIIYTLDKVYQSPALQTTATEENVLLTFTSNAQVIINFIAACAELGKEANDDISSFITSNLFKNKTVINYLEQSFNAIVYEKVEKNIKDLNFIYDTKSQGLRENVKKNIQDNCVWNMFNETLFYFDEYREYKKSVDFQNKIKSTNELILSYLKECKEILSSLSKFSADLVCKKKLPSLKNSEFPCSIDFINTTLLSIENASINNEQDETDTVKSGGLLQKQEGKIFKIEDLDDLKIEENLGEKSTIMKKHFRSFIEQKEREEIGTKPNKNEKKTQKEKKGISTEIKNMNCATDETNNNKIQELTQKQKKDINSSNDGDKNEIKIRNLTVNSSDKETFRVFSEKQEIPIKIEANIEKGNEKLAKQQQEEIKKDGKIKISNYPSNFTNEMGKENSEKFSQEDLQKKS